jgi:hypothetical protein
LPLDDDDAVAPSDPVSKGAGVTTSTGEQAAATSDGAPKATAIRK